MMSEIGKKIVELEESGDLEFNEETSTYEGRIPEEIQDMFPNPFVKKFDMDFAKAEAQMYMPIIGKTGDIEVRLTKPKGNMNNYLNKWWHLGDTEYPVLTIKGEVWMSLTPMELQSAAYAYELAEGKVATAGLGMGYFALKCAEKPEVESVTVYEVNQDIIDHFVKSHEKRPYFDKIIIIRGDVHEHLKGQKFDLIWLDIYQTMCPDDVMVDLEYFRKHNPQSGTIMFWGYELCVWAGVVHELREILEPLPFFLKQYFQAFMADPLRMDLSLGSWDLPDVDYVSSVLQMMRDLNDGYLP
jgi:hypothetical protein